MNQNLVERPSIEPTEPILEVIDCTKDFGGVHALDRCSLSVRAGSITGLIGPNGAGKTTLFNVISGFLKPTSGHVLYRGERIEGLAPHAVFAKRVVRTFQIPRQFTSMSVIENLMLVPRHQIGEAPWNSWLRPRRIGLQEAELYKKAEEVLRFVNLAHLRDDLAGQLSGGQKKLLELARTLMCDPDLVLLDEPGAGVNPSLTVQLMANVERLRRERGITFLVIEHNMDLVAQLCDAVIVMSEGRHLMDGTPDVVRRDPRVLEAYLGHRTASA